jgi:hypothetical protein
MKPKLVVEHIELIRLAVGHIKLIKLVVAHIRLVIEQLMEHIKLVEHRIV